MMAGAGALWLVTMVASLDASKPSHLPVCQTQEESPELTAFEQLRAGSAFHVEVKWDAKAGWIPAKPIAMPSQHASRIEWTNGQAWPMLAESQALRLRFLAWLLVEDHEQVPGQNGWRVTYQARIDGLCRVPKVSTKTEATVSVYVVDEAGDPIVGASVTGKVTVNPSPIPSTCCNETDFGQAVTDRNGRAVLPRPPFTFRPVSVTANRAGWPEREVAPHFKMEEGELRTTIVLGPPRTVSGTVEVDPGCPARFLRVENRQQGQTALVDAKGYFVLHGVWPWTSLQVVACGRHAGIKLDEHPRGQPILLKLASPTKQTRDYVTPTVDDALPRPPPSRVAPAGTRPCFPPGRGLIAAGDFEWVS